MKHNVLMHEAHDDVAVAVVDLKAGEMASAVTLEGVAVATVKVLQDIPLGHKIAMRAMPEGHELQKYGRTIGKTTKAIAAGEHVHVQNLKTMRW